MKFVERLAFYLFFSFFLFIVVFEDSRLIAACQS